MAYIFGSIWDRFNRNALNNLSKSVEQQGKSIQDLVAEGQLTPEQYSNLISAVNGLISSGEVSVHDINKSLGKLDGTFFTSSFLEALNNGVINTTNVLPRTIGNLELSDKSVSSYNTDFIEHGKNLFDNARVIENTGLNSNGDYITSNGEVSIDYLIPISPSTNYYKNGIGRVVYFDGNINPIGYLGYTTTGLIKSPENAYYMKVSCATVNLNNFQVERGISGTSYEVYKRKIDNLLINISGTQIENESVPIEKLSGFLKSRNMIDRNNLVAAYINMPDGKLISNSSNRATEDYIPVNAGITYNLQPLPSAGENFNIAYYNGQKRFVSSMRINDTSENGNLTIPAGVSFIRLSVAASHEGAVQLELGDVPTEYESYYMYHPGIVSPMDSGGGGGEEGTQAPNYLEVLGAYDVRFSFPITSNRMSSFRFSNNGTGDDFMKGRESSVLQMNSNGSMSTLYDLTHDASNKEFALSVSDGTQGRDWFPEHNGVSTAHEGAVGFRKLFVDGNNIDISKASNIPVRFNTAVLTQKMELSLPYDTTPRAILTFVVTIENGECKESVRIEWKKKTTVHSGYILMTPMSTPGFVDGLLTDEFEYLKSKPDATTQTQTSLNNTQSDKFYFTSNRTGKNDIVFITELLKQSEPVKSLFWQHRSGLIEKLYPQQYNDTPRNVGDIDYFEGMYKIKSVPRANEIYKMN